MHGCHTLQPGDRITLAYASECDRSPEFIFECQSNSDSVLDLDKQLTDCDILCLVVNPNQPLSIDEKQLIEKVSKTYISKSIIIFDVPTLNTHLPESITANIAETEAWLHQNSNLSVELAYLSLSPFYSNGQATAVNPEQQNSDKFHEFLEVLAKREGENIITKRVLGQLQAQITLFERVFTAREEMQSKELQRQEEKLQEVGQIELKDKIKNSLKQVNKDKEKAFRQLKNDLGQSKAALLDEYVKKSVYHKIETFVDKLQPFVAKREGLKFVRLQSGTIKNGGSVNLAINSLCQLNLREWGTEEWERICNTYAEGGLNSLFQRTYATLNFIPSLKLPPSLLQPVQNIDIYEILQESIVEAPNEISYQDISLVGYLLKSIRSNVMTLGIVIAILGLFGIKIANKNEIIKEVLNLVVVMNSNGQERSEAL